MRTCASFGEEISSKRDWKTQPETWIMCLHESFCIAVGIIVPTFKSREYGMVYDVYVLYFSGG